MDAASADIRNTALLDGTSSTCANACQRSRARQRALKRASARMLVPARGRAWQRVTGANKRTCDRTGANDRRPGVGQV